MGTGHPKPIRRSTGTATPAAGVSEPEGGDVPRLPVRRELGKSVRRVRQLERSTGDRGDRTPHVRDFTVGEGLPSITTVRDEIQDYVDVLLGRVAPPIDKGVSTLAEVASAYYARAREIEMILLRGELDGHVIRGSAQYRYRTGELRSFIELAKNCWELGSRRITVAQMALDEGA
jgi:hypothetical protein